MMATMVTTTPRNASAQAFPPAAGPPPALRPTFQPSRATKSTLGPGAACESAIDEVNCASLSQPFW
ncbi:hypothetical protein D9M68_906800 [compost metagenome]